MARTAAISVILLGVVGGTLPALGQHSCQPPPKLMAHGENMFSTEEQEEALGDIMADQVGRHFRTSNDPAVAAYLNSIAARLLKHMPETSLKIHVELVDLPEANAFTTAGGRIYVGQKMAALARNEDELAGILAHELGHAVTLQIDVEMSQRMKRVLKVEKLGDRRDVIAKYNQLLDNWRRHADVFQQDRIVEEELQTIADRVGIFALAASGYSPEAFADVFDRLTELHGRTGSWLSDLFGETKPEGKRLREAIKSIAKLPDACVDERAPGSDAEFKKWQAAVIEFTAWNQQEILHNVAARTPLAPQLRDRIRYLRFSPDGHYILAQDSAQIYLLTKEPLQNLFQIDAPDALEAQFSPDSKSVVFSDRNLRVEKWDIGARKRIEAHELVLRPQCLTTALSPDGEFLACDSRDQSLKLVEVGSGTEIYHKNYFATYLDYFDLPLLTTHSPNAFVFMVAGNLQADLGFSPDGKYFLGAGKETVTFDLTARHEISIKGPLAAVTRFVFLGPDRVLAGKGTPSPKAEIIGFPGNRVLSEVNVPAAGWQAATHGDYIIWHPQSSAKVAVYSLSSQENVLSSKVLTAMDLYDQNLVSEARDGEIGLLKVETRQPFAQVTLPSGSQSGLETVAVSPVLDWLAVSNKERGAIWNLTTGTRTYYIRGFRAAYMPDESACFAEFPKFEEAPHSIEYVGLHAQNVERIVTLDSDYVWNFGSVYIIPKWEGGQPRPGAKMTIEAYDARLGKLLWSREFRKARPAILTGSGPKYLVYLWDITSFNAREEIKNTAFGKEELAAPSNKKANYFIEVVETLTGNPVGAAAVTTGKMSFDVMRGFASADWAAVSDTESRLHIYSLADGQEKATLFGQRGVISEARKLLAAENGQHLTLFDLATLEDRDDFTFKSPIVFTQFSSDGNRLLVLTRDQTVYTLNVAEAQ